MSEQPAPNVHPQERKSQHSASTHGGTEQGHTGNASTADGQELTEAAMDILERRKLNIEKIAELGWKSLEKGDGNIWIKIPYYCKGKQTNSKYRTINKGAKKFYQDVGSEKHLYNCDVIAEVPKGEPLVITEGEMDCVVALQLGFFAVSVPDGAPAEAIGDKETPKYDYLDDIPPEITNIIIAADSDVPGAALLHDLSIRLGKHRCRWVKYPDGCKDLNEVIYKHGAQAASDTLRSAKHMSIEGLYSYADLPPLPEHRPIKLDVPKFDNHYAIRRADFSVVTGIPSHGKTTFVNWLTFLLAKNHGWHITTASFEQPPQTEHRKNLCRLYHMKPFKSQEAHEISEAESFINDRFSFIVQPDSLEDCTVDWMLERMAAAVNRYNSSMLVVDPWNEMDHQFNSNRTSLTEYVGRSIKEMKHFAKKYQVHVMVVAHPAKQKKMRGKFEIPTLYDISDSAHWYNKSDQGLIVHRKDADTTVIRIAKSKYHDVLGRPGDVKMVFDDYTGRFRIQEEDD